MTGMLHVINPNSSAHVTAAIERAAAPFLAAGHAITCVSMADGPAGIETEADMHAAVAPMLAYAEAHASDASGVVIACFGDPGLHLLRERYGRRVYGIAECGVLAALMAGQRFGVISILEAAVRRHYRYFTGMGVLNRLAGDRAIGIGVAGLKDRETVLQRMLETGARLKQDGAEVILMGGAAMSHLREPLAAALEIPVIDPTQAAIAMATGFAPLQE
jgi:Asp/Glu/hydantoin racemase